MFATRPNSLTFRLLAACLEYPNEALIGSLDEARELVQGERALRGETRERLLRFLDYLCSRDLLSLQENYVALFDRGRATSLHLFEHVHGESRARGQAMVDLLDEYRGYGLDVRASELPDYVPLFLEVLGLIGEDDASELLGEAIHVLAALGNQLERDASPYAGIFTVLCEMSVVEPLPVTGAPIRDMDEALERFGVGPDGIEPLLQPFGAGAANAPQVVQFHPRAAQVASSASPGRTKEMQ